MKLIMENWRKFVKEQENSNLLSERRRRRKKSRKTEYSLKDAQIGWVYGKINVEEGEDPIISQHNATKLFKGASMPKPFLALIGDIEKTYKGGIHPVGVLSNLVDYRARQPRGCRNPDGTKDPLCKSSNSQFGDISGRSRRKSVTVSRKTERSFLKNVLGIEKLFKRGGLAFGRNRQSPLGIFHFLRFMHLAEQVYDEVEGMSVPSGHPNADKLAENWPLVKRMLEGLRNGFINHIKKQAPEEASFNAFEEALRDEGMLSGEAQIYGKGGFISGIYGDRERVKYKGKKTKISGAGYCQSGVGALNYGVIINETHVLVIYMNYSSKDLGFCKSPPRGVPPEQWPKLRGGGPWKYKKKFKKIMLRNVIKIVKGAHSKEEEGAQMSLPGPFTQD
tara:strand:- start:9838 stop:11010 length:1173 start_codon:yes stop_codon:yes gene_type:complete